MPLLSGNGAPIIIPENTENIEVRGSGEVLADGNIVDQIKLSEFTDDQEQALKEQGNGIYFSDDAPQPAQTSSVIQGMIEGSNVNGVLQMTNMIDVSRSYQSLTRMMSSEHDRQRTMIRQLSQPGQ